MVSVTFQGYIYKLREDETILEGLLRHNVAAPYSCQSGICQTCMMQITSGSVAPAWQQGLKDTFRQQQYFLPCVAVPTHDITVQLPSMGSSTIPATITHKVFLSHNVVALHLKPHEAFSCSPGQYLNLILDDGLTRSYSIANIPETDGYIELHIRKISGGRMSNWAYGRAQPGDLVHLRGPAGECFYINEAKEPFDMLLAGTGTGLAPLYGIIRDALAKDHPGNIRLIHGALTAKDLYYVDELKALEAAHSNFHYIPCIREGNPTDSKMEVIALDMLLMHYLQNPTQTRVYFCGAPDMVSNLKTKAFLGGVASRHIYSDAFLQTKQQSTASR